MQPDRIEKVKSLIAAALARRPEEREAFLANACAGDPDLRREIDVYLNVGDKTDRFFYQAETVPNVQIPSLENAAPQPTVQVPADPRIGKEFGKYVISSRVAEGGMGVVYRALDRQLGREVALKILPEYFSMDRERLSRFYREARATSLLNHPNIVTVFDIGQIDGCEFIVTELVEGRTLREIMQQGPIPFIEMLKIASQIAGALAAAHRAGIIHRDIKPENVMLRPDGYAKVLDFGLAKLTDTARKTPSGNVEFGPGRTNQTMPGVIMGTVSYMSPEQAEGLGIDARTDIWALGVILYEMVTGKLPFRGPTPSHTIVAILEQDPEPIQNASPELRHIIFTALQKDRALRYQTADAMSTAIDEVKHRLGYTSDKNIAGPGPTVSSIAAVKAPPRPQTVGNRKFLWLIPAAAVILLVGAVGIYAVVAWLIDRNRDDRTGDDPIEQPLDIATPTPLAQVSPTLPIVASSPTPLPIYVDPTPSVTPEQRGMPPREIIPPVSDPRPPPVIRQEPARTLQPVEARKTPERKKKPAQDPNCVFTNSCN